MNSLSEEALPYAEEMTACRHTMHHVIYRGLKERTGKKVPTEQGGQGKMQRGRGEWNLAKSLITVEAIMKTQLK